MAWLVSITLLPSNIAESVCSGGTAPVTVDEMARDTIAVIRAMGFDQVNLLGFSLGGFVAQDVALKAPALVRKLILTGTGPAGGRGIDRVGAVSWPLILKGPATLRDPKTYLFFTATCQRPAGGKRLPEKTEGSAARRSRRGPTPRAFSRQLKAIKAWGQRVPQDLAGLRMHRS
ncbi:alpha/beta fold hydrolase [Cupriavidus basilensis]